MNIPAWVTILAFVLTGAATFGVALAVLKSRYRVATDAEREKYIAALEARNKLLEDTTERQATEINALRISHSKLEGQVEFLGKLVIGKCAWADIDPETSKCRHCDRSTAFGGN